MPSPRRLSVAHSPDTDDIFMFWALKTGRIVSPRLAFDFVARDIEELNRLAHDETYDVTALSFHAYAKLADRYALLSSGASMAEKNYGPLLVAPEALPLSELKRLTVAVPGENTTAFLLLQIAVPEFKHVVVPAAGILDAVKEGRADAGLLIHEGQIRFAEYGYKIIHRAVDTWRQLAGDLPLPLGGSAVRKSLDDETRREFAELQKASILCGLENREAAKRHCLEINPALSSEDADRYLSWYVNRRTVEIGPEERAAIGLLFDAAFQRGLLKENPKMEIL